MKLRISRKVIFPITLILIPLIFFNFFIFLFLILIFALFIEIYRIYRYFEITEKEIIEKVGIINIQIKRAELSKISTIKKIKGPLARIFGYGNIIIKTYDGETFEAKYISNPEKVEEKLKKRLEL
ncbi:MAG: PH domain-containing protein [Candidatus Aenigmatarchaeota archaeon]